MFWRTPNDWPNSYAVDAEGRLIENNDQEVYVIENLDNRTPILKLRTDVQVPELEQWGVSPKKMQISAPDDYLKIVYDGQEYHLAFDGSFMTPELPNYQP